MVRIQKLANMFKILIIAISVCVFIKCAACDLTPVLNAPELMQSKSIYLDQKMIEQTIFHFSDLSVEIEQLRIVHSKIEPSDIVIAKEYKWLQTLVISNCSLTEFGLEQPLRFLTVLRLSFNQLQYVNFLEQAELPSLMELDLRDNQLSSFQGNQFTKLIKLEQIDLRNNDFNEIDLRELCAMGSFWYVRISTNARIHNACEQIQVSRESTAQTQQHPNPHLESSGTTKENDRIHFHWMLYITLPMVIALVIFIIIVVILLRRTRHTNKRSVPVAVQKAEYSGDYDYPEEDGPAAEAESPYYSTPNPDYVYSVRPLAKMIHFFQNK